MLYIFYSVGDNPEAIHVFIMCTFTVQNVDDMKIKSIWSLSLSNRTCGEDLQINEGNRVLWMLIEEPIRYSSGRRRSG